MGLHDLTVYTIYRFISASAKALWRSIAGRKCRHGVLGGCSGCRADEEERRRDAYAQSSEGLRQAEQVRINAIYEEYLAIDEELRETFKLKVEDRVQRYDLKYGQGDFEAAVIRMYKGYLNRRAVNPKSHQ